MTFTWLRRLSVCCAASALVACTGTPVTEPPSVAPPELPDLNAQESVPAFQPGQADALLGINVSGGRGAVAPNALVWTLNLDADLPPIVFRADADGSFAVPVQARVGDELRMHVIEGDAVSPALDMVVGEGFFLESPEHGTCVRTMPTQIDLGDAPVGSSRMTTLQITNTCDTEIALELTLHASASDFAIDTLDSVTLAPEASTQVEVRFEPAEASGSLRSSALLIDVERAGMRDRIAVSLWGRAR